MAFAKASGTIRDAKNQTATAQWVITTALVDLVTGAGTVALAWGAASNGHLDRYTGTSVAAPVAGGTSGRFIDVEDKCVVVVQTASGTLHRYEVPAPKDSCFLADDETMDGSGPAQAYGAALVSSATTPDGDAFTAVVGGYRIRRKAIRKFNVRTRNPALSGQGL